MIVDHSIEYFEGILSLVSKWRAIPLSTLHKISGYSGTKTSFYRVIRKLEDRNLIKATNFNGKAKIITPTLELSKLTSKKHIGFQEESITHEAIVSMLCSELMSWELFSSVTLPHEVVSQHYDSGIRRLPDAVIEGSHRGNSFKLALEVEITRKSKIRIQNKIEDYLANCAFDFIFYVFNDRSVFESYQRFIKEVLLDQSNDRDFKSHQSRFIFGFSPLFIGRNCKLDDLDISYMGKNTDFETIFGKKRM